MGRPGKEARRLDRARPIVERAIERGDVVLAMDGWPGLSPDARAALRSAVSELFDAALARAARDQDWRPLVALAVRADRARDLVSADGEERERARWWCLLWACLRQNDRHGARAVWARIRAVTTESCPELGGAIESMIEGEASGDTARLLAILPASERTTLADGRSPRAVGTPSPIEPDPRLGFEPVMARVDVAAPTGVEDVPRAVTEAHTGRPWDRFVRTIEQWAGGPARAFRPTLWTVAAKLALLESIAREHGRRRGDPTVALRFFFHAAGSLESDDLATERGAAVRWTFARAESDPRFAELLTIAGRAALGDPALTAGVCAALCALPRRSPPASKDTSELYASLLGARPSDARLWLRALDHLSSADAPSGPLLRASASSLDVLLGDESSFCRALRQTDSRQVSSALDTAAAALPVASVAALVDRCWSGADEMLRGRLAALVGTLVRRADERSSRPARIGAREADIFSPAIEEMIDEGMTPSLILRTLKEMAPPDIPRQVLRDLRALVEEMTPEAASFGPKARALWATLGPRAIEYQQGLLSLALDAAPGPDEQREWIDRSLGATPTVDTLLATGHVVFQRHDSLAMGMLDSIPQRFGTGLATWQRAGDWCVQDGCGCAFNGAIAERFARSFATHEGPPPPGAEGLLRQLRRAFPKAVRAGSKIPKRRAARKKKATTQTRFEESGANTSGEDTGAARGARRGDR